MSFTCINPRCGAVYESPARWDCAMCGHKLKDEDGNPWAAIRPVKPQFEELKAYCPECQVIYQIGHNCEDFDLCPACNVPLLPLPDDALEVKDVLAEAEDLLHEHWQVLMRRQHKDYDPTACKDCGHPGWRHPIKNKSTKGGCNICEACKGYQPVEGPL